MKKKTLFIVALLMLISVLIAFSYRKYSEYEKSIAGMKVTMLRWK